MTSSATTTTSNDQLPVPGTDLFHGSWRIGTMLPGSPLLTVHLTFAARSGCVAGFGQVTQATNPPLDVLSRLGGDFTYLTVMPDVTHVLVTATGFPVIDWPSHGGSGPVLPPNLSLRMVLTADWRGGTATFQYTAPDGTPVTIESATVELVGTMGPA